jgi:hypothetical protein
LCDVGAHEGAAEGGLQRCDGGEDVVGVCEGGGGGESLKGEGRGGARKVKKLIDFD